MAAAYDVVPSRSSTSRRITAAVTKPLLMTPSTRDRVAMSYASASPEHLAYVRQAADRVAKAARPSFERTMLKEST